MELDYRNMTDLVDVRLKQINDASMYHEYFNKEYRELSMIRKSLTELLLLERNTPETYVNKCNAENVDKSSLPRPSEINPPQNEPMDLLC